MVTEASQYIGIAIGLVSMLGVLNVFFIVRLVKKLDSSSDNVKELQIEVKHLAEKISALGNIYDRIAKIEKQIALIQYAFDSGVHLDD